MRNIETGFDICHLTSVHDPLDTRIYRKECRSLSRRGYRVVLIAPGAGGVDLGDVRRSPAIPPVKNRFVRMLRQPWRIMAAALKCRAKVYHFHDPELLVVGIMLKLAGKLVVYDVHESVGADISSKSYLSPALRRLAALSVSGLERFGSLLFDGIITATPFIARGFDPRKTVVVQNFPVIGELAGSGGERRREDRILYMGSMSDIRGISEMVRAMELLPAEMMTRLVLVGRFSDPAFESSLRSLPGWAKVEYHPWQERGALAQLMYGCRLGLILLSPAPNHYYAYPNKLFEYMSAGLPVLASDFPLWREIVEGAGCGCLVDPTDPIKIAERISWFISHPGPAEEMGKRGREAVLRDYNWDREEQILVSFYEALIGPPGEKALPESNHAVRSR
jgi:glycosyltransferase involved in cell wall biosynthesis